MDFFDIDSSGDPGMLIVATVAFAAGLIRGFTGFGGPAFMLAVLTLFFTPLGIVPKIMVVDFIANIYLFKTVYRQIDWPSIACLVLPTLLFMPLGHWLLIELDPLWMKRLMALIIASACLLMLAGFRYRLPMTRSWLVFVGICSGLVFGATYIALVAVVFILLGPYDKNQGRSMIISWAFFSAIGFALISAFSGTTDSGDLIAAAPGALTYLLGTWLGSLGFRKSGEKLFRRSAIAILLVLSVINLVG